jgi:glutamyl-tRNA synthetase
VAQVCGFIKERATFVKEFWDLSAYFFVAPASYDEKAVRKYWSPETLDLMKILATLLETVEPFTKENIELTVNEWIKINNLNAGAVMNAFRLCIVGASKGPSMFEIAALLKKEIILERMHSVV